MTCLKTLIVPDAVAGLLRVTGDDAFDYLQSQFSNDLRRPGVTSPVTYGLWLTRKGKVAADSLVARTGPSEFVLISFHIPSEKLSEKVLENVIADDVESSAPAWPAFTVAGEQAGRALASLGLPVPAAGQFAAAPGALVVSSRRGAESYEVFETDPSSGLAGRIRMMVAGDAVALESLRISSGIPRVPEDCGPGDLPQEAGLDADAVSFTKGCYLGQEVMARLQSQGRTNRVLTRLSVADAAAAHGSKLYAGMEEAGEVRSQVNTGAGLMAMAMLRIRAVETAEALSLTPGGTPSAVRVAAS